MAVEQVAISVVELGDVWIGVDQIVAKPAEAI